MFQFKFKLKSNQRTACYLSDKGYSVACVNGTHVSLTHYRELSDKTPEMLQQTLSEDMEALHLLGCHCDLILAPGLYQLILMDAVDVPVEEMAKALRWRVKGLIDYPLNDTLIDVFLVPPHGVGKQRKKVFVAATLQSALQTKLELFKAAYLVVDSVSITELAIRNIVALIPDISDAPVTVISLEEDHCQMQIIYQNHLYLIRELAPPRTTLDETSPETQTILLEIQRSIDYCLSELKLPEPQKILFTPNFYQATRALDFIQKELGKEVLLIDLNHYLTFDSPLNLSEQQHLFCSIGGALTYNESISSEFPPP